MPKIKGTKWYTAAGITRDKIEDSERHEVSTWFGYRRPVQDISPTEIRKIIQELKAGGINCIPKISQNNHTDIPAGTPYLQVSDTKSVARLEAKWARMGISLDAHRFDVYKVQISQQKKGGR